ncbi:hypothetical protein ACG94M_13500 [Acinetobacter guillouiae]|uniref:hypothetical protein n=1 Tax=Acinetobacter guillouiae TaxID=106649 RepID=UPI003AF8DB59
MTLIVAINLNNYLFLASDQRLTIECEPSTGLPPRIHHDGYKKIRYWKHGAIVTSGDVILMDLFYKQLILKENKPESELDLILTSRIARVMYLQLGFPAAQIYGCAFFSVYTEGKVELIHLSIKEDSIEYETVKPMHAHFSLFAGLPDDPIYQQFVNYLKNVQSFESFKDFYNYHMELLKYFYKRQYSFDKSITSTFDLFIQNKKNGKGFTQTIKNL